MLRGFYTAANGIINEQRIINVKTNNLANVQTAGYKADTAIPTTFAEKLLLISGDHSDTGTIRYRTIANTYTDLQQGTFENTNSRLDMAISGSVYFNVASRKTGEILLTKSGQFSLDYEGYLSLGSSGRVVDENGDPIKLDTADFTVSTTGQILTDNGRTINLGLSYLDENVDVEKVADNLLRPYEPAPAGNIPIGYKYSVMQGWYERSNVDTATEMVEVMNAQGVFTACSNALKIANSINQIACNDLAKI